MLVVAGYVAFLAQTNWRNVGMKKKMMMMAPALAGRDATTSIQAERSLNHTQIELINNFTCSQLYSYYKPC